MASAESKKAIYAAILGNFLIAVAKFIAAGITRSSSMLAEGIHSLVDTGNGVLLLVGVKRGSRPADDMHPFGYGKELYFWSLIVAITIFAAGGGASIYEGVRHVLHPSELHDPTWAYVVLALAFVFEGIVWLFAWRAFRTEMGSRSVFATVRDSKDPTSFMVLFEDTAALLGIVVAATGIWLSHLLNMPVIDGVASVVIGLLLCTIAWFLAAESKALLVGERADPETIESIRRLAQEEDAVDHVGRVLTMHLGPREVLVNVELGFRRDLDSAGVEQAVDRVEAAIREAHSDVTRIFVEAEAQPK